MNSILFITRGLHDKGGIERITSFVASQLAERGYKIGILCLQRKSIPFFRLADSVAVFYLDELHGWGKIRKIRTFLFQRRPDLVILVGTNRSISLMPACKGFRVASWEHFNTTIQSHPLHPLSRRIAAQKGWIITLTEADAESYRKKYHAHRVITLPNAVPIKPIISREIDKQNGTVIAVGRLKSQKGFERLIRSWSIVSKFFPQWKLRVVGSGRKETSLRRLIDKLHLSAHIELVAHTRSIAEEYAKASIYALSSHYEGFALAMVEAISSGLPCVSFDIPRGPKELLTESKAGILVQDGNIEEFAKALMQLMDNAELRKKMSVNALLKAKEYTPQNIMNLWQHAIQQILNESIN